MKIYYTGLNMPREKQPLVEELLWKDVREVVTNTCKELATIIDGLSPTKEYTVFRVRYPFGTKVSDKSQLYLPTSSNASLPMTCNEIESNCKKKLTYSSLPLGILTKNSAETFYDINKKVFSLSTLSSGMEIGIGEHLGWSTPYSVIAGARSLYMLPKISEALSHKQLRKRFGITESPPKHLHDHWRVFHQIANSDSFPTNWFCEVIFLSNKWAESIKKDAAWSKLASYINQKSWHHFCYSRKKSTLDIAWEIFVRSLSDKDLKSDPYIVDTLKHIMYISTGTLPASAPSTGDDEYGPLKDIQMIYEDTLGYGLNEYLATIMQPQYFSPTNSHSQPVYYSLQLPTLLESLPRTKKITSVIDNIRELSELLHCFLNHNQEQWSKLTIGNTALTDIINNLQIDYFHGDMFAYGNTIKSSLKMPEHDQRLKYNPSNSKKRIFASNGSFLKGCVRIAAKK